MSFVALRNKNYIVDETLACVVPKTVFCFEKVNIFMFLIKGLPSYVACICYGDIYCIVANVTLLSTFTVWVTEV